MGLSLPAKAQLAITKGTVVLIALLLLTGRQNLFAQKACRNVGSFDFKNSTLTVGGKGLNFLPSTATNYPASKESLTFRKGVSLVWDSDRQQEREPDFSTTIRRDLLVYPKGSRGVRVLLLEWEHLTGRGQRQYVMAYDCQGGKLHTLLDISGDGLDLQRITNTQIDVSLDIWVEEDAFCCPSRGMKFWFRWSPRRQAYAAPQHGEIRRYR